MATIKNNKVETTPVQAMWLKSMATMAWDKMHDRMKARDKDMGYNLSGRRWHETYTRTELENAGFWYGAEIAFELKFGREMTKDDIDLVNYIFLSKEHEVKAAVGKDALGFTYYATSKPAKLLKLEVKFAGTTV